MSARSSLMLRRRADEAIEIATPDGVVEIHVKQVRDKAVELRVIAPRHYPIRRTELDDAAVKALRRRQETVPAL